MRTGTPAVPNRMFSVPTSKSAVPPDTPLPTRPFTVGRFRVRKTPAGRVTGNPKAPWSLEMGPPPRSDHQVAKAKTRRTAETTPQQPNSRRSVREPSQPGAPPPIIWHSSLRERYGVNRTTIYRWQRSGLLPPPDVVMGRYQGWYATSIADFEQRTKGSQTPSWSARPGADRTTPE